VTFTRQGFMAGGLAAMRPRTAPIFAFTPSIETFRQMRLMRAVEPILLPFDSDPDVTISSAIGHLVRSGQVLPGDKLVIATDILSSNRLVDSVQLRTVR
jgi:pyruvate kinase